MTSDIFSPDSVVSKVWLRRRLGLCEPPGFRVQSLGPSARVYWQQLDVRAVPKWHGHSPTLLGIEGVRRGKAAVGTCGLKNSKVLAHPWSVQAVALLGFCIGNHRVALASVRGDGVEGSSLCLPPWYTYRWTNLKNDIGKTLVMTWFK